MPASFLFILFNFKRSQTTSCSLHRAAVYPWFICTFLLVSASPGPRGKGKGTGLCSLEKMAQNLLSLEHLERLSVPGGSCYSKSEILSRSLLRSAKILDLPQSIHMPFLQQVTERCWFRQFIWMRPQRCFFLCCCCLVDVRGSSRVTGVGFRHQVQLG